MKYILSIALIIGTIVLAKAQDIIIKIDQTEIKCKVVEVTETTIKYKKWKRQDGPTYSINKQQVYLIVYSSGEREYYGKQQSQNNNPPPKTNNYNNPPPKTNNYNNPPPKTNNYNNPPPQTNNTRISNYSKDDGKSVFGSGTQMIGLNLGFGGVGYAAFNAYSLTMFTDVGIYPINYQSYLEMDFQIAGAYGTSGVSGLDNDSFVVFGSASLAVGYAYAVSNKLKLSAGVGYFYRYITVFYGGDQEPRSFSGGSPQYYSKVILLLRKNFGVNLRYDYVAGLSFGIILNMKRRKQKTRLITNN